MRRPRRVSLRSVLFHHVANEDSTFTAGLDVRMAVADFERRIAHLARWYHPVSLEQVRAAVGGEALPRRALLVTFDDAYASIATEAAEIVDRYSIPSVFFVNGGFVDHDGLGIDNLVAHTFNTAGGEALGRAAGVVRPEKPPSTIHGVLADLVPALPMAEVGLLRAALIAELDHDPRERAEAEAIYVTRRQLASLPASMVVGSHTRSHVCCRMLDRDELITEIDGNRRLLVEAVDSEVSSFSVPYGSADDFPAQVAAAVIEAGHDLSFLVEGRLNHGPLTTDPILRVGLAKTSTAAAMVELEVLPRMRYLRDLVRG